MKEIKQNILGTPYTVKMGERKETGMSEEHMGVCKIYSKEILVDTEKNDCTEDELEVRLKEIVAHEIFHAFVNEAGIDLDPLVEEQLASFYMKNWDKMTKAVRNIMENYYLTR